jgi:hypothetical protein
MTKQEIIGELLSINEKVKQKNADDPSAENYAVEKAAGAVTLIRQYKTEDFKEKESVRKALEKMGLVKDLADKSKINGSGISSADVLTKVREIIEEFVIETQGLTM